VAVIAAVIGGVIVLLAAAAVAPMRPLGLGCPDAQRTIDTAGAGSVVDLRGCTYDSGVIVRASVTVLGGRFELAAGRPGIRVVSDGVTLDGVTILGPQADAYDHEQIGISAAGEPGRWLRDLVIRDSTVGRLGNQAIALVRTSHVTLERNTVHDTVYGGIMVLSGVTGRIVANRVERIGLRGSDANSGNAYGIALTRGGSDPNANPATTDWLVHGNVIEDVPTWHALDTHGGQRIEFADNIVRGSYRAVFVTGDDYGDRPQQIGILRNQLLAPEDQGRGAVAITMYRAQNVTIVGNRLEGWPAGGEIVDYLNESSEVQTADNVSAPRPTPSATPTQSDEGV
jgi:hypothetical protein